MKWLLLMAVWLFSVASSFAGNELGNGGDGLAQEFVAIGRGVAERLRAESNPAVSADTFLKIVESTSVSTKSRLELNGSEVDAINYPSSGRIELNRSRWKEYGAREKASLVFHEYLGIAGIDDSNYEISGKYVEIPSLLFQRTNSDPAMFSRAYSDLGDHSETQFFAGFGSGASGAGGNLKNLYKSDGPTVEARIGYNLSRIFTLRGALEVSKYKHNTTILGSVDSDLLALGLAVEAHIFGNPRFEGRKGLDPYLFGGPSYVSRRQFFQSFGDSQRDSAWGLGGGAGLGYFLSKRVAIGAEARVEKIFFRDRFDQIYALDGVVDMTGFFYGGNANVRYYF